MAVLGLGGLWQCDEVFKLYQLTVGIGVNWSELV